MSQRVQRAIFSGFTGLVCLLGFPRISRPQIPGSARDHAIGGSVRSEEDDSPIPQARVQLLTQAGSVAQPAVLTNNSGEFVLGQFPPGEYEVLAEHEGYQPARASVDINRHDETSLIVHLRKAPVEGPNGGITTAHQLQVPQKARAAFDKGMVKADSKGDFQGAVSEFQRAINNYPGYYEAYSEMGLAYVRLKDFPSAERALRKSIELSSTKYPPPLMLLCMILNDQNRFVDAEPVARQAIAAEPRSARGHYELARALFSQHHLPEAETATAMARDLKPDNPDVYLLRIEIHRSTQNASALLLDIDTYLKLAPQGPAAPHVRKLREQLVKFMESHPQSAAQP